MTLVAGTTRPSTDSAPPAPPTEPPFKVWDRVTVTHDGPSGPIVQHGLVVDVLSEADADDRVLVAWFSGLSGPLPVADVEKA